MGGDAACQHEGDGRYYTMQAAATSSADAFIEGGPANAERLRKGRWRERGKCVKCGAVHTDKQIGMETTPEEFIETMVAVFREVRRVLRDDGTLWLNLGDSYATGAGGCINPGSDSRVGETGFIPSGATPANRGRLPGLKAGDLCNVPNRVASALCADGWYWRSTIIWAKRSPMPESVSGWRWVKCRIKIGSESERAGQAYRVSTPDDSGKLNRDCIGGVWVGGPKWQACPGCDKCRANGGYVLRRGKWRPTTAHEYVFLFSKSERYFADGDTCAELAAQPLGNPKRTGQHKSEIFNHGGTLGTNQGGETRNPRSVWTLSHEPYKAAHFATFPPELVWKILKAATSAAGCCAACGSPFAPVVESERVPTRPGDTAIPIGESGANRDAQRHIAVNKITGYRATCACNAEAAPCKVFDPFAGAGTVGMVAENSGRAFVGCELNPEYVKLAEARIATPWIPKERRHKNAKRKPRAPEQMELFK